MKPRDKFNQERIDSEFWIDTRGRQVKWAGELDEVEDTVSLHSEISRKVLCHIKEVSSGMKSGGDILHKLGWIAFGSACYGNRIDRAPTQAQINTLFDLGYSRIREFNGILHEW